MELPHLVFLFLLAVAKAVAGGGGRVFLRDLLNSILIFVALLVGNVLSGYLRETRFDLYVAVILGFLGIFLGGFKASAAGISAALIFGYLASLIFEPKMKK